MGKRNMKQWCESILASEKKLAIPIMTHPGIDLIGKRVIDAVKDGEIHAESIIALSSKYPSAAATVIMDLTVEAEAFGAELVFEQDEVPNVVGRLASSYKEVEELKIPELSAGRVQEYLKANRIAAEKITDKPVLAGCIGPFSLAGRLFDMTEIMMAIYTEPETAVLLLEKCTDFIIKYVKAIKETGADGVVIAEPAAGLLSNEDATEYSTKYLKKIVDAIQDENFLVVLHNCGNTGHCTQSMIDSGAWALHFGNKIDIVDALKEVPSNIIVMGNLDPVSVFKQASTLQVSEATAKILKDTKEYKNFIVSSGCDTPPGVPIPNIEAFYNEVDKFNK